MNKTELKVEKMKQLMLQDVIKNRLDTIKDCCDDINKAFEICIGTYRPSEKDKQCFNMMKEFSVDFKAMIRKMCEEEGIDYDEFMKMPRD